MPDFTVFTDDQLQRCFDMLNVQITSAEQAVQIAARFQLMAWKMAVENERDARRPVGRMYPPAQKFPYKEEPDVIVSEP